MASLYMYGTSTSVRVPHTLSLYISPPTISHVFMYIYKEYTCGALDGEYKCGVYRKYTADALYKECEYGVNRE